MFMRVCKTERERVISIRELGKRSIVYRSIVYSIVYRRDKKLKPQ